MRPIITCSFLNYVSSPIQSVYIDFCTFCNRDRTLKFKALLFPIKSVPKFSKQTNNPAKIFTSRRTGGGSVSGKHVALCTSRPTTSETYLRWKVTIANNQIHIINVKRYNTNNSKMYYESMWIVEEKIITICKPQKNILLFISDG